MTQLCATVTYVRVVNNEPGTIVWPNGADFCPDMLHNWATGQAVSRPDSETPNLETVAS